MSRLSKEVVSTEVDLGEEPPPGHWQCSDCWKFKRYGVFFARRRRIRIKRENSKLVFLVATSEPTSETIEKIANGQDAPVQVHSTWRPFFQLITKRSHLRSAKLHFWQKQRLIFTGWRVIHFSVNSDCEMLANESNLDHSRLVHHLSSSFCIGCIDGCR